MVKKSNIKTTVKHRKLDLAVMDMKMAAAVLRAINHEIRQQILHFIHDKGSCNVKDIYGSLKLEQSVASLHLAILRKAGLVLTERLGQSIFYEVNYDRIATIKDAAKIMIS